MATVPDCIETATHALLHAKQQHAAASDLQPALMAHVEHAVTSHGDMAHGGAACIQNGGL